MSRIAVLSLLGLLGLAGCGRDATDGGQRTAPTDRGGPEDTATPVTPTEYAASLLFVPADDASAPALVLHLSNRTDAGGVRRRYVGWLVDRSGWRTLLDAESHDRSTRAPWRLLPTDSLRITITAEGEPDALILRRGSEEHILDLGERLESWEDRSGTRHEIRSAELTHRGRRAAGFVLQHRFAIPRPVRPARFGPLQSGILRSSDGTVIALFHTGSPDLFGEAFAWMYAEGLARRWTQLETRAVEVAHVSRLRRNIPIRTWFRIPEPDIQGELSVATREVEELPAEEGPRPYHALYRVRGWIEVSGERQEVVGVLERGEP